MADLSVQIRGVLAGDIATVRNPVKAATDSAPCRPGATWKRRWDSVGIQLESRGTGCFSLGGMAPLFPLPPEEVVASRQVVQKASVDFGEERMVFGLRYLRDPPPCSS